MDVSITWIRTPNELDGPDPNPSLGFLRLISGLVYGRIFSDKQQDARVSILTLHKAEPPNGQAVIEAPIHFFGIPCSTGGVLTS